MNCAADPKCSAHTDLDAIADRLGVVRNKRIIVPCSGCAIGCHPVSPLDCFCVLCVKKQREPVETARMAELLHGIAENHDADSEKGERK